jgi:hypothetical protein
MQTWSKDELIKFFEAQPKKFYKKRGRFLCRSAEEGETVLTIVVGKLETLKRATANDIIIRNIEIGSSAETYIISDSIFIKRYDTVDERHIIDHQEWTVCLAKGKIEASLYAGETVQFMAPWNENMICEAEDFIVRPLGGDPKDIYRIEKNTFAQTYTEMTGNEI